MPDDDLSHEEAPDPWQDPDADPDPDAQTGWPEAEPTGIPRLAALVATFVIGAVTALVLVLTWTAFTNDPSDPVSAKSDPKGTSALAGAMSDAAPAAPGTRTTGTRLSRCASAARALGGPLRAAQPALDQWAVHIGAMNKLVVGEITLQDATAFWERTRVGAQRRVEDFREAMTTLRRRGLDCPGPELLAPGARALPGCAREVRVEVALLHTAGRSIDLWEHHVHQMDMLRRGEITPEDATRSWLTMWQQGARDLDTYRAAARQARPLGDCTRAGSGSGS